MIKVGVAKQIISPELGALLAGYPRERKTQWIADDLEVTAIAIGNEKETALLISATLTCLGNPVANEIRRLIKEKFGITSTVFSLTHTHSGPVTYDYEGWGLTDAKYTNEILIPKTLIAVEEALSSMQEAKVGVGQTESFVGVNRRLMWEGKAVLDEDPNGIFDKRMFVVSFVSKDDKPICNIVSYGAHATSVRLNDDWYCVSRDWPGEMVDAMEKRTGAITAFLNSTEGDVAPRRPEGMHEGLEMKKKVGEQASKDAIRAYGTITEYKEVDLKVVEDTIKLPYDELPSLEFVNDELKKYLGELNSMALKEKQRLLDIIEAHKHEIKTHMVLNQVIIAIGDIAFVPFSFEPFTEIGLKLFERSPFKYTFCISNANGYDGYLPTAYEITRGGYEVWGFKNSTAYVLTDNADEEIIKENLRLLNVLKNK